MLILHVNIHVKPEYLDEFRDATIENARNSVKEPGIARFDVVRHAEDPNRFALWEVYHSQQAIADHKLTAHYATWTESVEKMMAEPRTRTWYSSVAV
jgi:autoinducer 2-degrading protein